MNEDCELNWQQDNAGSNLFETIERGFRSRSRIRLVHYALFPGRWSDTY